MSKDGVVKTLVVATLLCVFCSVLVSISAVGLKDKQLVNKKLDLQKNLLLIAGVIDEKSTSKENIEEGMKKVKSMVIDFATGEKTELAAESFDQLKASKTASTNYRIDADKDLSKIRYRAQKGKVFLVNNERGELAQIVLPIKGSGLWSVLYGFISLSPDTKTVVGIGFYEHGETPGLGGEIENPKWQALWKGKMALDNNFNPQIEVVKGIVEPSTQGADHKIDGLSGATITSAGVQNLVNYWLGDDGFGKFLTKFRNGEFTL